ncbi:MAG: hypothetical protein E6J37_01495, partial [Chloroflexi bacterium]
ADLVGADGTPWPTCGRALVRRVDELVGRELGAISLGFEQEGYVLRKTEGRYEPVVLGKQMQPETLDLLDPFVTDLNAALEMLDVPVEKLTAEGGWGMFEVNFEHARPLEAAERYFRYKQAFRTAWTGRHLHAKAVREWRRRRAARPRQLPGDRR